MGRQNCGGTSRYRDAIGRLYVAPMTRARPPRLIVFAGLSGTGKSTLAQRLARETGALYLRIDALEQAIRDAGVLRDDIGSAGYAAAHAVAEANLHLGRDVIIDAANTVEIARQSWRDLAASTEANLTEIVITCSDPEEHRRRVETRTADVPGLIQPSWAAVIGREWEPWPGAHHVLDTARVAPNDALKEIRRLMGMSAPPA
jgi:predicted kinase